MPLASQALDRARPAELPESLRVGSGGSYHFDNLEVRNTEAHFLVERAQLRLDGFVELIKRHGCPERGRALEVGCGPGVRARLMAAHFPKLEVVALDRSAELVTAARRDSRARVTQADLYELPFADESFDFIYARLVFMHLDDPLKALRGLSRVLRPSGRILIEDADRQCMFFEPAPHGFAAFWEKVQEGQRQRGGDPNVGRRLAPYLKALGFRGLSVEAQPIIGGGDEIAFMARTLLPGLTMYLDPKDRREGERVIRALDLLAEDPLATFYHFWFAVSGARPS